MSELIETYDKVYMNALNEFYQFDINSDEATTSVKNLKVLSECRPPVQEEPEPKPEPNTVLEKVKVNLSGVWDNETTRVLIKAGGAFAGVALVTWTTVRRDHVITRDALSQANLRNS